MVIPVDEYDSGAGMLACELSQSFNSTMQLPQLNAQKCTMTGCPLCAPVISCQLPLSNGRTASLATDAPGVSANNTAPIAAGRMPKIS